MGKISKNFLENQKFSVLLPVLDRKDIVNGLPKALESIFKNSLQPDQVLITIDGLVSDSFKEILKKLQKKYSFELLWINKKVGLDKALNLGIEKCKNEYIFRADGDDINDINRFKIQLPYLLNGNDLVGSYIDEYNESGSFIATKKVPISNESIYRIITFRNPINHMTVGFKKSSILEVGGYPELFLKGDYGLWIKLIASNKKFINLNLSLVKATTGMRMIKDRGGFKYLISEYYLQKFLLSHKLTNLFLAFFVFIVRISIFSLPKGLKFLIYKNFLRS